MNCKSIRISLWFSSAFLPPVRFCEYWRYLLIFEGSALKVFKNLALIWAELRLRCWAGLWTEAAAILDSGLATASILDFKPRLGNRCSTIVAQRWMARLQMAVADAGGDRIPRRRHNPKYIAAGVASVPAASRGHFQFWLSPLLANA